MSPSIKNLAFVILLVLTACGDSNNKKKGNNQSSSASSEEIDMDKVVQDQDRAAITARMERMWPILISPECWDASVVTDPGHGGSAGIVNQFQFFADGRYRHVGFSTDSGSVQFYATGSYEGKDILALTTWTDDVEYILIVNETTIVHYSPTPDGKGLSSLVFGVNRGTCL